MMNIEDLRMKKLMNTFDKYGISYDIIGYDETGVIKFPNPFSFCRAIIAFEKVFKDWENRGVYEYRDTDGDTHLFISFVDDLFSEEIVLSTSFSSVKKLIDISTQSKTKQGESK